MGARGRKKKEAKSRKRKKAKQTVYYRDGEVVGDVVLQKTDCHVVRRLQTVMLLCPESLLREVDGLSDFNYVDRSDFMAVAGQMLFNYLDGCSEEVRAVLYGREPVDPARADDILMSQERYPYDEDDDDEGIWCAAEDEEEGEGD